MLCDDSLEPKSCMSSAVSWTYMIIILCVLLESGACILSSAVFLNNWIWCVIQFQVYMTLVVMSSSMFLEGCEVNNLWTSLRIDCSSSYVIHCNQNHAYPVMCFLKFSS